MVCIVLLCSARHLPASSSSINSMKNYPQQILTASRLMWTPWFGSSDFTSDKTNHQTFSNKTWWPSRELPRVEMRTQDLQEPSGRHESLVIITGSMNMQRLLSFCLLEFSQFLALCSTKWQFNVFTRHFPWFNTFLSKSFVWRTSHYLEIFQAKKQAKISRLGGHWPDSQWSHLLDSNGPYCIVVTTRPIVGLSHFISWPDIAHYYNLTRLGLLTRTITAQDNVAMHIKTFSY